MTCWLFITPPGIPSNAEEAMVTRNALCEYWDVLVQPGDCVHGVGSVHPPPGYPTHWEGFPGDVERWEPRVQWKPGLPYAVVIFAHRGLDAPLAFLGNRYTLSGHLYGVHLAHLGEFLPGPACPTPAPERMASGLGAFQGVFILREGRKLLCDPGKLPTTLQEELKTYQVRTQDADGIQVLHRPTRSLPCLVWLCDTRGGPQRIAGRLLRTANSWNLQEKLGVLWGPRELKPHLDGRFVLVSDPQSC